jgi:hypothetical protein
MRLREMSSCFSQVSLLLSLSLSHASLCCAAQLSTGTSFLLAVKCETMDVGVLCTEATEKSPMEDDGGYNIGFKLVFSSLPGLRQYNEGVSS